MISQSFAQNFVSKISHMLQLNINIMNEKAIIIASSTPERIGDFHICAHEVLTRKLLIHVTESPTKELIGVNQPGVNLLLLDGSEPIGVIGVSGNPKEVLPLVKMAKFALESMLDNEGKQTENLTFLQDHDKLTQALLFESPMNLPRGKTKGYRGTELRSLSLCLFYSLRSDFRKILFAHIWVPVCVFFYILFRFLDFSHSL